MYNFLWCLLLVSLIANFIFIDKFLELKDDFKNHVVKWENNYFICERLK